MPKPRRSTLTAKQIETLRRFDSATIANAVEAFEVRHPAAGFASLELRCMFPELPPAVGYALTCTVDSTTPRRGGAAGMGKLVRALRAAPKPAIVVMKSVGQEPLRNCHIGDVMGTLFHRMGAVAAVSDAGVRDLAGIAARAPGLQIFAVGTVVSHGDYRIVEVGPSVSVCGLTVSKGDLLHGDANGLVSIPHEIARRLPTAARKVTKAEAVLVDYIQGPAFDPKTLAKRFGAHWE
jgi:regulator of RNase E activity RraA